MENWYTEYTHKTAIIDEQFCFGIVVLRTGSFLSICIYTHVSKMSTNEE